MWEFRKQFHFDELVYDRGNGFVVWTFWERIIFVSVFSYSKSVFSDMIAYSHYEYHSSSNHQTTIYGISLSDNDLTQDENFTKVFTFTVILCEALVPFPNVISLLECRPMQQVFRHFCFHRAILWTHQEAAGIFYLSLNNAHIVSYTPTARWTNASLY